MNEIIQKGKKGYTTGYTLNENSPVFWVKIEGNLKEKISKNPHVFSASYEKHVNKTFAGIKTDVLNRQQQRQAIRQLANELKKYSIHNAEIEYFRNGASIYRNSLN